MLALYSLVLVVYVFFFFKQKTAYEMRISDWSSDVCSSDLLKIKIFADGADLDGMKAMAAKPWIKGLTTNPTLMRKAGITDYAAFARRVLDAIPDKPTSFEVFADNAEAMTAQGRAIGGWGPHVNVKLKQEERRDGKELVSPSRSRW